MPVRIDVIFAQTISNEMLIILGKRACFTNGAKINRSQYENDLPDPYPVIASLLLL